MNLKRMSISYIQESGRRSKSRSVGGRGTSHPVSMSREGGGASHVLLYLLSCVYSGSNIENWHSIVRRGLLNASGTNLQIHGAAHGSGIYLSPKAAVSFGYSATRVSRTTRVMAVCFAFRLIVPSCNYSLNILC